MAIFTRLRFWGSERFGAPVFPVEVLPELIIYRDLVFEAARQLYLDEHRGRRKVPNHFEDSFQLSLVHIEEGSLCPVLARALLVPVAVAGLRTSDVDAYYERARHLVEDVVQAVDDGAPLPPISPQLVDVFGRLGNSLTPEETLFLRVPQDPRKSTAPFSIERRDELLRRVEDERWDHVELTGDIIAADRMSRSFTLMADGRRWPFRLTEETDEENFRALFDYTRDASLVKVGGQAHYLRGGKFKDLRVESVALVVHDDRDEEVADDQLQFDCKVSLEDQIRDLGTLPEGWHGDGEGHPYRPGFLSRVHIFVQALAVAYGLPMPYLYPTVDGDVRVEWPSKRWEVVLRFMADEVTIVTVAVENGSTRFHEAEEQPETLDELLNGIGNRIARLLDGEDW